MSKNYDYQNFYFTTLNGSEMCIRCWTYEYSNGWGHKAALISIGSTYYDYEKRITYYNRTYECFKYKSVIYKLVDEFYNKKSQKMDREFIYTQLKTIADNKREEAEAWIKNFTNMYNSLSSDMKDILKNADITLNTQEDAEAIIKSALTFDACMSK